MHPIGWAHLNSTTNRQAPKPEARNPKAERRPKSETREANPRLGLRPSQQRLNQR